PENTDATEENHRDDVELEAVRHIAPNCAKPGGIKQARQRRIDPGRHKQPELDALDAHARIARRFKIIAEHIHDPAESGAAEHDRANDEEDDEYYDRKGQRSDKRLLTDGVEPVRIIADRPVLHEDTPDAAIADQPGEGYRKRWKPYIGDPETVDQPGEGACTDRRQQANRKRDAEFEESGHYTGCEAHDRGDR